MKLVVQFVISGREQFEHRNWVVDGEAKLQNVVRAAVSASYLAGASDARIINTRIATDMDVRTTRELPVAAA